MGSGAFQGDFPKGSYHLNYFRPTAENSLDNSTPSSHRKHNSSEFSENHSKNSSLTTLRAVCAAGGTRCPNYFRVKVYTHHIYRIKPRKHPESAPNPCQIVFRENLVFKIALRADQSGGPPVTDFQDLRFLAPGGRKISRPLGNHCTIIQRINKPTKIKPIGIKTAVFDAF